MTLLSTTELCVARCLAWAPNLVTEPDWRAWALGERAAASDGSPAASAVPAMVRRRLTRWGRLALQVASELVDDLDPQAPVIFSSRHGDTERTQQLLTDLAHAEPLSPTAFSLSVHNAPLGLFTIVQQITAPSLALAAGKETLAQAWLEAATWLAQGASQVLLVHADEPLAGFYQADADEQELPQALALLLTQDKGTRVSLTHTPNTADALAARSMAIEFLSWWYGDATSFDYASERLCWTWRRDA